MKIFKIRNELDYYSIALIIKFFYYSSKDWNKFEKLVQREIESFVCSFLYFPFLITLYVPIRLMIINDIWINALHYFVHGQNQGEYIFHFVIIFASVLFVTHLSPNRLRTFVKTVGKIPTKRLYDIKMANSQQDYDAIITHNLHEFHSAIIMAMKSKMRNHFQNIFLILSKENEIYLQNKSKGFAPKQNQTTSTPTTFSTATTTTSTTSSSPQPFPKQTNPKKRRKKSY